MNLQSIEELLKHLYNKNPVSGDYIYRGQSNSSWPLIPSIHRGKMLRYETVIAEAFLLYFLKDKRFKKDHIYTNHPIEILAMCQHYGIPTRLLDFSHDILTSLFFACSSEPNKDGSLYILDKKYYSRFDFNDFNQNTSKPLLLETHIINPRLRSQSGSFLVWGKKPLSKQSSETYTLEEYNEHELDSNPIEKIIIPSEFKDSINEELDDKYGINHESVYLNNEFSKRTEKAYKNFKRLSDIIIKEITGSDERNPAFNLQFNLAGCLNLESLPLDPPMDFHLVVTDVINKFGFEK